MNNIDNAILGSAKLLKLLSFFHKNVSNPLYSTIENINIIEFLSSYPLLVFKKNDKEYSELIFSGFPKKSIEYNNIDILFVKNTLKTINSIKYLLCKGLIDEIDLEKDKIYKITEKGDEISNQLHSDYYQSYSLSISYLFSRIKELNTINLKNYCKSCLIGGIENKL